MITYVPQTRHGIDGCLVTITYQGRVYLQTWRWSEDGARQWVREQLTRLAVGSRAA